MERFNNQLALENASERAQRRESARDEREQDEFHTDNAYFGEFPPSHSYPEDEPSPYGQDYYSRGSRPWRGDPRLSSHIESHPHPRGYFPSRRRQDAVSRRNQGYGGGMDWGWGSPPISHRREQRRAVGRFFGIGPKGYVRSDERIQEEICERLAEDADLDPSQISLQVTDGEVLLQGSIDSRSAKYQVEELVESVRGVKNVSNQLRVLRNTSGSYSQRE